MNYQEKVSKRLKLPLKHHPYLSVEFKKASFFTIMENRNPNMLGHYAGGDMAYIANAAAAMQCVAEGVYAQSASINVECIAKGEGEVLLAQANIIHKGRKLIRTRVDVYVRKNGGDTLVAIAQINMSPMTDQAGAEAIVSGETSKS
jgi:acyl-coenzyme A thioesterase PaaI-like protein